MYDPDYRTAPWNRSKYAPQNGASLKGNQLTRDANVKALTWALLVAFTCLIPVLAYPHGITAFITLALIGITHWFALYSTAKYLKHIEYERLMGLRYESPRNAFEPPTVMHRQNMSMGGCFVSVLAVLAVWMLAAGILFSSMQFFLLGNSFYLRESYQQAAMLVLALLPFICIVIWLARHSKAPIESLVRTGNTTSSPQSPSKTRRPNYIQPAKVYEVNSPKIKKT